MIVFAGPNGSGKSTLTDTCCIVGAYINADDIARTQNVDVLTAARQAESERESSLESRSDFTFETVLSTERNLLLLERAKQAGYFIRGYYVLTCNPMINVARVKARVADNGHDVPNDKIISRYYNAMALIPHFIDVCDVCTIYDNSLELPEKIFKKYHGENFYATMIWQIEDIRKLIKGEYIPNTKGAF